MLQTLDHFELTESLWNQHRRRHIIYKLNQRKKSTTTSYSYAGTNKANPHAPTSIGGVTLSYDNNGNLTSYGSTTLIWDYRNRIIEANAGTSTIW